MLYTELPEDEQADFLHACRKNLNNRLEVWIKVADEMHDVQLTELEALQMRNSLRAEEDKGDRFHPMLKNDAPWF